MQLCEFIDQWLHFFQTFIKGQLEWVCPKKASGLAPIK